MRYTRLFECDDGFSESVDIGPDLQRGLSQETLGTHYLIAIGLGYFNFKKETNRNFCIWFPLTNFWNCLQ